MGVSIGGLEEMCNVGCFYATEPIVPKLEMATNVVVVDEGANL